MDDTPAFSPAALVALDRLPFDPAAQRSFSNQGFSWSDEFPLDGPFWDTSGADTACWHLLDYRHWVVRGAPEKSYRGVFDQVATACPGWPGLRPERWSLGLAAEWDAEAAEREAFAAHLWAAGQQFARRGADAEPGAAADGGGTTAFPDS